MRKFLLLMIALLAGVSGAWADSYYFATAPTRVTSITSGNYYVIDGLNQQNGGTAGHYLFDNGTKVTSDNPQTLPTDGTAGKFIWKIVGNSGDGYTLQNVGTGNYMSLGSSNGSQISTGNTPQNNVIWIDTDSESGTYQYGTICNASSNQAIDIGAWGNNPTTWAGSTTSVGGSRRLAFYEVEPVEITDDVCYTIDFVSKDQTKTWGLKSGTSAVSTLTQGETGDVYVAHSYTNSAGNKRWIFVNNSNGTYLEYHGQASTQFNITNGNNEFEMCALATSWAKVDNNADCSGKLFIRAGRRNCGSYPNNVGTYIISESTGNYDNSDDPFYNGSFTSALRFTATGDAVSSAANLAIAKFEALCEVKDVLACASNISALYASPSSIEANINAAETAEAAATIATNFMKSPEGKKFYAVNSNAPTQYLNIGETNVTATSTKLYAEAVMEVEYAGGGRYYMKGIKNATYACTPNQSIDISTTSTKGSAETFFILNKDNTDDNKVYFSNKKTSGNYGAIHYSGGYIYKCVGWTYDSPASQWDITYITDEDYENLCNVNDVTYNVLLVASGAVKATTVETEVIGSDLTVPALIARDFCTYTFYSDAACTSEITTVANAATSTVYALTSYTMPFAVSENYASATWHNMKLQGRYPLYNSGNTPNVTLPDAPGTEDNVEWAFIGNPYDGFQIINKGAGDGNVLGAPNGAASDGNTGGNTYATFATAGTQDNELWFPRSSTHYTNGFFLFDGEGYALNYRSPNNLAFWTTGYGPGSTFTVSSVEDNAAELLEIANRLDDYTYGAGLGKYSLSGVYAGWEGLMESTIIPGLKSSYSYEKLLNARGLESSKSLNMPTAGMFLRFHMEGENATPYVKGGNAGSPIVTSPSADGDRSIFYYDDDKLLAYTNGIYAGNDCWDMCALGGTAPVSFSEHGNYHGRYQVTASGKIWHVDDNTKSNPMNRVSPATGSLNTAIVAEEITTLPVSISTAGYATFCSPVAVTIPSGVTAYIATDEGDYLHLEAIAGDIIPANAGVILAGTPAIYDFDITTGGSVEGNELTGTVPAISRPVGSYILSNGSEGVGFYPDGAESIPGFKAYLAAGGGSVKPFRFDDADAIKSLVDALPENRVIYNIAGQRVDKLQRGVNIVNGKKVIVK